MTPWTDALAKKLAGLDQWVTLALIGIILITAYILIAGKPKSKAIWLAYVLLP